MATIRINRLAEMTPATGDYLLVMPAGGRTTSGTDEERAAAAAANPLEVTTLARLRQALNIPVGGGDANVQADWTETDTTDHSFIRNKPQTITVAERSKLNGIEAFAQVNINADWDATEGSAEILNKPSIPSAPTARSVTTLLRQFSQLSTLSSTDTLFGYDASSATGAEITLQTLVSYVENNITFPDAPDGGLQSVHSDATLSGRGTSDSPLAVANPFTNALAVKLNGIAAGAEVNVNADWNATSGDAQILNKPTIPAAQVQADWNVTDSNSLAFIANKPSIPAAATTQSVTTLLRAFPALTTLNAADTLFAYDASASQGVEIALSDLVTFVEGNITLPDAPDGGLQSVHSDATLSGQGTSASPLSVANPFTNALEAKLTGIAAGAEVNVNADWNASSGDAQILNKPQVITAAERTKLAGIAAGAEVNVQPDWNAASGDAAILNKPTIPAATTLADIIALQRAATDLTVLADEDSFLVRDASTATGAEVTLASLAAFVESGLTIPDAEVDEIQFAVATVLQGQASNGALANVTAGNSSTADVSFETITRDAASLGFNHATGRLSFGNTHTDRDTRLTVSGRIPIQHEGLPGRLRVYFREYESGTPDTVNREVTVADHPITESSTARTFHFPLTSQQVLVRRGRTYKFVVEFTASTGAAANAQVAIIYTLSDAANLVSFYRHETRLTDMVDWPTTAGTTGQLLAVASDGGYEFVDAASGGGGGGGGNASLGDNLVTSPIALRTSTGETSLPFNVEVGEWYIVRLEQRGSASISEFRGFITSWVKIEPTNRVAEWRGRLNAAQESSFGIRAGSTTATFFNGNNDLSNVYLDAVYKVTFGSGSTPDSGGGGGGGGFGSNLISSTLVLPASSTTSDTQAIADIGVRLETDKFYYLEFVRISSGAEDARYGVTFRFNEETTRDLFNNAISVTQFILDVEGSINTAQGTPIAYGWFRFENGETGNSSLRHQYFNDAGSGQVLPANTLGLKGIYEIGAGGSSSSGGGATTFVGLTDTPSALTGQAGKYLAVNSGADAIELVDAPAAPSTQETFNTLRQAAGLSTLNDADSVFGWDASSSAPAEITLANLKAFVTAGLEGGGDDNAGGGSTTWLGLTDTPSAWGSPGSIPAVNAAGNALEFVSAAGRTARERTEYIYARSANTSAPPLMVPRAGRWFFGTISTAVESALEGTNPTAAQLQAALDSNDVEEVTDRVKFLALSGTETNVISRLSEVGFNWDGSRHADDHGSLNFFLATTADINAQNVNQFSLRTYAQADFGGQPNSPSFSFTIHKQITDANGVVWNVWGFQTDTPFSSTNSVRSVLINGSSSAQTTHRSAFSAALRRIATAAIEVDGYVPFNWTNVPIGITDALPVEWVAGRKGRADAYGEFSTPVIIEQRSEFLRVNALPAPTALGMTAFLDAYDPDYHQAPGLKRTAENPITMRNRSMVTVAADPLATAVNGALANPANHFGNIPDQRAVGGVVWSTGAVPYVNVYLDTALMGDRTEVYIDFGSSEFSTDPTRRYRFNRGTTTGNFTAGGRTFRTWAVDNTINLQSDALRTRLQELEDASGNNDLFLDLYTAETGIAPLNHIPEFIWRDLESQIELKQKIEVPRDQRVLLANEIFADAGVLKTYDTEALLTADLANLVDGEMVRVRNTTPGSADADSKTFVVEGAIAGTNGTRGAVSHRNRISMQLLEMGNGAGFYYTANVRSLLRTFNNVQDAGAQDPQNRIGFISFFDSGGTSNRPYIQVGIDPALTTRNTIALVLMNRETSTGGNAPQLDVDVTRTGTTARFANKDFNVYRYDLNAAQATALGIGGWIFKDDTLIMDVLEDHLRSESVLNFNPDTVEFTAGSGFARATNAIAAKVNSVHAPWVDVYTNAARNVAVGVGGHWNLDIDISDAFEVRMVWGSVPTTATGRNDEDSRLLIPPFIYNETGSPAFTGAYTGDNYAVRLTFGQYAEYVFSKQSGAGAGVINRVTRVSNPSHTNNSAQLYSVEARF